ncbi:hypothetical protein VaNZ11_008660 [Volvox africanus]|uniref:Pherophorin domain-containing protein n=1 Tax=Volvox africanus TaxID=51714 RepID=A0ABQ5S783_9CHLO|nr:hypothetical protein VaNZ11_008660 [Volvox africanus]
MIGPQGRPAPHRLTKLTLMDSLAAIIIWLTTTSIAAAKVVPASPPSIVSSTTNHNTWSNSCGACAIFKFLSPSPSSGPPPSWSFIDGYDDSICYEAYSNVSTYLDQPLFKALESKKIPDLVSGFIDGDSYCKNDAIMFCARFASRADALVMQDAIREGVRQVMNNYFCAVVPGAYGFTALSSDEYTDESGNCFPLNISVVCQQLPFKPPPASKLTTHRTAAPRDYPGPPPFGEIFPSKCAKAPGTTPLHPTPYFIAEPGRSSKTQLYCIDIKPKSMLKPSRCSSEYLLKVEIWADDSKRSFIKGTRVTKNRGTPIWGQHSWGPTGDNILKVTPLKWTMSEAMGSKICIEVSKEIADLSEICLGDSCYISLYNEIRDCCPVYRVAPEPSPPPPDYFTTFP